MTATIDPTQRWMRQLGQIRMQAAKLRRKFASGPQDEVTDAALSVCDAMVQDLTEAHVENQRLRAELQAESRAWVHLFENMPSACLLTDSECIILNANPAAGKLLNVTPKRLKDRHLLLFAEDRSRFADILTTLGVVTPQLSATLTLRPKERRPIPTSVIVTVATQDQHTAWLWFLVPCEQSYGVQRQPRDIKANAPSETPPETVTVAPSVYPS